MTNPLESRPIPDFYYFSDKERKIRLHSYWINTRGRVYSARGDKILANGYDANGYAHVVLYGDEKKFTKTKHHLVAEVFPELIENSELHFLFTKIYCEIDHRDNKKWNNNVENLRWCKNSENARNRPVQKNNKSTGIKGIHKTESGTFKVMITTDGEKMCKTFKTLEESREYAENYRKEYHKKYAHN